jgi:ElaA protein
MLSINVKSFNDLSKLELYKILKLRAEVFIVEQNCVYQDIDDKDQKAFHVILLKDKCIIGYTRIFGPGDYFNEASIGRVVISEKERHNNYGSDLMKASIDVIYNQLHEKSIKISAQCYLENFYKALGFVSIGESYLEDGIPHIAMIHK